MKKFDVDKIKLKVFEIYGKAKEANDLPTLHIIAIISELVSSGIVEDEADKEDNQCPFDKATTCFENECAGCETSAEWFANKGKDESIKDNESDPILEVYEKFKGKFNISEDFWGLTYDNLRSWWKAIEQYAKSKGKV